MTVIKRTLLTLALSTVALISIELTSPPGSIDVFVSCLDGVCVYIAMYFLILFLFGEKGTRR